MTRHPETDQFETTLHAVRSAILAGDPVSAARAGATAAAIVRQARQPALRVPPMTRPVPVSLPPVTYQVRA